jgi:D-alanyl-D-alanine carboxypeptidase
MLRRTGQYDLDNRKVRRSPEYKFRWGRAVLLLFAVVVVVIVVLGLKSSGGIVPKFVVQPEEPEEFVIPRKASNAIGDAEIGYIPRETPKPLKIEPIKFTYDGDRIEIKIPKDHKGEPTIGQSCLVDYDNKKIIWSYRGHEEGQIASMTKMMLLYTAFALVDSGVICLFDTVAVSDEAPLMGGSQVYIDRGERYTVSQLLSAIAGSSANDAAYLLSQYLGDLEDSSGVYGGIRLMNSFAARLGLGKTQFYNAHGLPPARSWTKELGDGVAIQRYKQRDLVVAMEANYSTPIEMAKLGAAICEYPRLLRYTNIGSGDFWDADSSRIFGPHKINNHFRPIRRLDVDGIKTGYTRGAGFCVTATAERAGRRLIAVVFGATTQQIRDKFVVDLFETAFDSLGIPMESILESDHTAEADS